MAIIDLVAPRHLSDLDHNPVAEFEIWFDQAKITEPKLPDAMTLATATPEGRPSARIVLLKQFGADGFVFFTNYESRKGQELADNPSAALLFHWKCLGRQVRIEGRVEKVAPDTSKTYFDSRPRESRLSAWASPQSHPIPDRHILENRQAELEQKYPDEDIPLPPFWGGYRVIPDRFEFWIHQNHRLHDRFCYTKNGKGWEITQLAP